MNADMLNRGTKDPPPPPLFFLGGGGGERPLRPPLDPPLCTLPNTIILQC